MKSDYEIANENIMSPIATVAAEMGLPSELLVPFGHHKAKINITQLMQQKLLIAN